MELRNVLEVMMSLLRVNIVSRSLSYDGSTYNVSTL